MRIKSAQGFQTLAIVVSNFFKNTHVLNQTHTSERVATGLDVIINVLWMDTMKILHEGSSGSAPAQSFWVDSGRVWVDVLLFR